MTDLTKLTDDELAQLIDNAQAELNKRGEAKVKELKAELDKYGYQVVPKDNKAKRRTLSPTEKKEMERLVKKGATAKELSTKFGVADQTAYNWINKHK